MDSDIETAHGAVLINLLDKTMQDHPKQGVLTVWREGGQSFGCQIGAKPTSGAAFHARGLTWILRNAIQRMREEIKDAQAISAGEGHQGPESP
jgi:hypothetical protein